MSRRFSERVTQVTLNTESGKIQWRTTQQGSIQDTFAELLAKLSRSGLKEHTTFSIEHNRVSPNDHNGTAWLIQRVRAATAPVDKMQADCSQQWHRTTHSGRNTYSLYRFERYSTEDILKWK